MPSSRCIALFGGSFNPIHVGHVALAERVLSEHYADEVWMLVSPRNPLKVNATLQPEDVRLEWVRQAVAHNDAIVASDFEFHLPRPSYTYLTLCALREQYPDVEFRWMIGADNWELFPLWKNPEEILAHHKLIVYPRAGYAMPEATDGILPLDAPLYDVSSTQIREHIRQGQSIEGLVPASIIDDVRSRFV